MTDWKIEPLDDDLRDLLAAEAERAPVDPAVQDRVLGRVLGTVAGPGGEGTDGGSSGPGSSGGGVTPATGSGAAGTGAGVGGVQSTGLAGWLSRPLVTAALAFVGGGVTGAGLHAALQPDAAPEARPVSSPQRVERAERSAADPGPPDRANDVDEATASPVERPETSPPLQTPQRRQTVEPARPARVQDVQPDASAGSSQHDEALATENALIDRATTALARGRPDQAVAALREHERRFPRGQQIQEREALLIQALARTGRIEEARDRGERFRSRWPRSPLRRAVDGTLE